MSEIPLKDLRFSWTAIFDQVNLDDYYLIPMDDHVIKVSVT